jgi:hypothetical protein
LDPIRRARLFGIIVVLSMAFLGVIYPVLTATTVVETVTETVIQPGRTITTVTVLEGGDVVIRIESPGFNLVVYYEKQDQVCVVRFTAMPYPGQPGVIAYPGTTIVVPGATATLVLNAPIETTVIKPLSTAFTTTGYTVLNITRTYTVSVLTITRTWEAPVLAFVYGLIEEACDLAYEISRSRIEPKRLPATVVLAFEGTTFTFPGFTFTMPTVFTEFVTRDPELENLRTTLTITKSGTTNTATVYIGPTTIVLRTRVEGSTVTTTVVMPGTTYVRTYLVTRTLAEPVATVTATGVTQTDAQPAQAQPAVTVTMAPAPGERAGQLFDPMMLGALAAVAAAVVIGILLGYRRGRY